MKNIKNVTVLGSGVMGHGIAQISATAGYNVKLRDIKEEFLDNAIAKIRWSLSKMVKKNKITAQEESSILSRIVPVVEINEALDNSDLIIEVVPENMDLKRKVYAELDSIAAPDTIFASNTSTLPITEIAKTTNRKDMVIGVHFFNPPQLMKLVEVIPGTDTSSRITETMENFVKTLGKTPVICRKDVPGFIINRLFIPMVHEALYTMDRQNISKEAIDSSVRFDMGFPMGIFELADFTGLDVIHKASNEMFARDKKVLRPHPTIQQLFEENRLGQKSGEGFYKYSDTKYERVELSAELAKECNPIDMISNITNNAAWLITNEVSNIAEIDKAAALGLGLKRPLFETAAEVGIQRIIDSLDDLAKQHGPFYEPNPFLRSLIKNTK